MDNEIEYIMANGDPRVENYPLMQTPAPTLVISVLYVVFVKIVGPKWMKKKQPYELRHWMMLYNVVLVAVSSWMFMNLASLWFTKYNWRCQSVDYTHEADGMKALVAMYVFYLSKFLEFLDTIFFILRKKNSQVTFLHVYHHAIVPLTCWYCVKYSGGGATSFFAMWNAFVHIWMYSYYGLSALGPSIQKYLWWKKYITSLQLIQFVLMVGSTGQLLLFPVENCNGRNFSTWLLFVEGIIFFVLFYQFYQTAYKKKKKENNDVEKNR